jgi:predicted ATPase
MHGKGTDAGWKMLKEYEIANFKVFVEAKIPIRPITLIFGANSSGKSAIPQSLLMLKQIMEESDGKTTHA